MLGLEWQFPKPQEAVKVDQCPRDMQVKMPCQTLGQHRDTGTILSSFDCANEPIGKRIDGY